MQLLVDAKVGNEIDFGKFHWQFERTDKRDNMPIISEDEDGQLRQGGCIRILRALLKKLSSIPFFIIFASFLSLLGNIAIMVLAKRISDNSTTLSLVTPPPLDAVT